MLTKLSSKNKTVKIAPERPVVLIGEGINPTGRPRLARALAKGDMAYVQKLALEQAEAGADVLDVNVGSGGVDEVVALPAAVRAIGEVCDLPLCLDSRNPAALAAALAIYEGTALVNSVNGEAAVMERLLPIAAEYGCVIIALCTDDEGIPSTASGRLLVAEKIINQAESAGIARENILVDCLAESAGATPAAGAICLEAVRLVRSELGCNMTLGASNISFGMPNRETINARFLAMAIAAGVNAPIVNAAQAKETAMIADLLMGNDELGIKYIRAERKKRRMS